MRGATGLCNSPRVFSKKPPVSHILLLPIIRSLTGSEDGKNGRLFILFIGLILRSHLRHIWSEKLRKNYPSSIDVLHEMLPIRYIEYPDGSSSVTGFTTPQVEISMAYSLPVPQSSLSSTQKAAMERKLAGRGRGRPKGSLNKKTILNFA